MKRIALGIATVLGLTLGVCPTAEHALAANPATFAVTVFMIQPPVLTVTRIVTPLAPGIGGPVSFAIVVTNAGTATVTDLSVTDTLPPQLVSGTASEPSGFPAPVVTGGASATRFAWSGSGLVFGPNQSLTFTVTGNVGPVCAVTALSDTPYVMALTVSGGTTEFGPAAGAVVQPATPALGAVQNLAPASPVIGGPVQYQVVVSNTGAATLDALTVV